VCRGSRALSVTAVGGAQQIGLTRHDLSLKQIFVRFYFLVPSGSPLPDETFQIFGAAPQSAVYQLGLRSGPVGFDLNAVGPDPRPPSRTFAAPGPQDRWTCLELMARFDPQDGAATLWLDDREIGTYDGVAMPLPPLSDQPINALLLGLSTGEAESGVTQMFYDEVVVSTSRIGC
jgi:hypothetical protein